MKHKFFFALLLFLVALGLRPAMSWATMDGLSLDELTTDSDAVVQGTVEKLTPRWSANGKKIITTAEIRVSNLVRGNSNYKNKKGGSMQVEYEGGEIGNMGYRRADVSILAPGDQVFMFLKAQGVEPTSATAPQAKAKKPTPVADRPHSIVGLGQGVYKINAEGMANKSEFSVVSGHEKVRSSLKLDELTTIVKGVK